MLLADRLDRCETATVAVVSVRIDPADTRRNQQVTFYVTFRNTFTTPQQRRWGVKISYADDGRKMGDTAPSTVEFPVGDSEWPSANNWGVNGKGDQLSLIARIVYVGLDGSFTYVPDLNGNDNAYGFVVKP